MTTTLTPRQRQYLKGLAHALAPVVRVGKGRVSDAVIAETKSSLEAHELIKVRIEGDESATRRLLAEELVAATDAHLVVIVGKTAIVYRERAEKPAIRLPK